jgi:two-component system, OmpR family, sensor kinase
MWATASTRGDRWLFPAWLAFAALGTWLMYAMPGLETVPFHLVWISMAVVYGLDPWPEGRMLLVLALVATATGGALTLHAASGVIPWEEVPRFP